MNENQKWKLLQKRKQLITKKKKNKVKMYKHSKYAENYLNNLYNSFLDLVALPMFWI